MMKASKIRFESDMCSKSKTNPKISWSHVRSKLKSVGGVSPLIESEGDESSLKYDDVEKANILQKQFCGVFTKEPTDELPHLERRTNVIIGNIVITEEMVSKKIKDFDPRKSLGPDKVHPKMLLELVDYVSAPLAVIMNKTLSEGTLPDDWKLAHVTPIYKNKGSQNVPVNHRPVSLTSIVCKLMESLLRKHLLSHLVEQDLLSKRQYGFIGGRSTVTQLL